MDVEPIYTFRAHSGPVLSLAVHPSGSHAYSGGYDATIRVWNIPSPGMDPYDAFDPSVRNSNEVNDRSKLIDDSVLVYNTIVLCMLKDQNMLFLKHDYKHDSSVCET